ISNFFSYPLPPLLIDLRKLIKYEDTLGINANQDNYFENLFKRTTASFRAKVGKENVRCDRVLKEKSKHQQDQHVLRPLNQQAKAGTAMAKKERQNQSSRNDAIAFHSGTTPDGDSIPRRDNGKQPQRLGTPKNLPGLGNLSREKATQSGNRRAPFGECNEPRGSQSETTDRSAVRTTKTTTAAIREPSPKDQAPTTTSGIRAGGRKESGRMAKDGDTQRNQVPTIRDASRGRTRARHPIQERGATSRSPSAASYSTAKSLGVIIPRHCTATRRRRPLSTDPVALYHYYQSEWNYFREQIPGESSHADLRWLIRARLMDPN
ncbi:uncharacterized protein LOC129248842, partial [Anastrepha obliqua]|uniref:uncharacterized protein LOC129248842 n=1 Tax=Anastrepha obliqua TaxID=95512 RepID=UPI002409BC7B